MRRKWKEETGAFSARARASVVFVLFSMVMSGCYTAQQVQEYRLLLDKIPPETLEKELSAQPKATRPWRVAVVRVSEGGLLYGFVVHQNTGQGSVDMWTDLVKGRPGVAAVDFLPDLIAPPGPTISYDNLRLAAVKRQCPLLLIVREEQSLLQVSNAWAIGYFTIVGAFFIPGTDCLAHRKLEALLVDSVSGYIFGDMIVTGKGLSYGPLYFVNTWRARASKRAATDARGQAAKKLTELFEKADKTP